MGSFMYIEKTDLFDKIEDMICVHLSFLPSRRETASFIRAGTVLCLAQCNKLINE